MRFLFAIYWLCWGSPRPSSEVVIHQDLQDLMYSCTHGKHLLQWKHISNKISKGKDTWDEVHKKKTTHKFPRVLPVENTEVAPNSSNNELWQHVKCCLKEKLETWCPGFSLRASYIGLPCLALTKIPDSQKESRCST